MNLELITIIVNYILILLCIGLGYNVLNKLADGYNKKNKSEIELLEMSIGSSIDDINQTIDTIISESIDEYTVINNIQKGIYIGPEMEQEIRQAVMNNTSLRISNVLLNKMKIFYREDMIPDVIAKKIFLAVSIFTASNNALLPQNTKK